MQSWPFRFYLPLPEVPLPEETVCYDVELPNDPRILEAFEGMVQMLSRWVYWQRDPQKRAIVAANVFRDLYFRLEARKCSPVKESAAGVDEGVEQMIRQNPTNPCLFETSINGTDWCVFADISKCLTSPTQPGGGTPQPAPGGGQQCYHAQMQASSKWLLPTLVNTGDVILITNAHGAASDGTVVWNCPNGALFQLGACIGSGSTSSGDPLNTSPHMMLIAKIGSTYYPMYNTTFTVPGGVTNQQVTFQVNDSNLADNYGDLTWDVCVTNNALGSFTHTFDFTLTDGGFSGVAFNTNNAPTYVAGTGWDSPDQTLAAGVSRMLVIKLTGISSRTFTSFTATYTIASATGSGTTEGVIAFPDENGGSGLFFQSQTDGSGTYNSGAGLSHADAAFAIRVQEDSANPSTVVHGHITLTKLVISGIGADPF